MVGIQPGGVDFKKLSEMFETGSSEPVVEQAKVETDNGDDKVALNIFRFGREDSYEAAEPLNLSIPEDPWTTDTNATSNTPSGANTDFNFGVEAQGGNNTGTLFWNGGQSATNESSGRPNGPDPTTGLYGIDDQSDSSNTHTFDSELQIYERQNRR